MEELFAFFIILMLSAGVYLSYSLLLLTVKDKKLKHEDRNDWVFSIISHLFLLVISMYLLVIFIISFLLINKFFLPLSPDG